MPKQASLFESGVTLDSNLEGLLQWDFASTTPGTVPVRVHDCYFILFRAEFLAPSGQRILNLLPCFHFLNRFQMLKA